MPVDTAEETNLDTTSPKHFNDSLGAELQAAMDAKSKAAVAEAPVKPVEVAPDKPETKPDAPVKPKSVLPDPDTYVPGTTKKEDWARIKTERDTYKAKLAEVEARAGKPAPEVDKVMASLKQERDTLQAQLRSIAIERDPAFDKEFSAARNTALLLAKNAVGPELSGKLEEALRETDPSKRATAIAAMMQGVPAYQQAMFGTAMADMEKLSLAREAKIAESRANWDSLQQKAQAEQIAREAEYKQTLESTIASFADKDKGYDYFRHKDGDSAHNLRVDQSLALARAIYTGDLSREEMAKAALWAGSAHHFLNHINDLQKALSERDATIEELTCKSPGAGDTGTGGTLVPDEDDKAYEGLSYGQSIGQVVKKEGLLIR